MSRVTEQFEQAKQYLAGGVTASTRVNRALGHLLQVRFNVRPEITAFRLTHAV